MKILILKKIDFYVSDQKSFVSKVFKHHDELLKKKAFNLILPLFFFGLTNCVKKIMHLLRE